MEDKNCEMLYEYLRSILYDSKIQTLDIEQLDEPFQKLGKGLVYLQSAVEEMLQYSEDLSHGNLKRDYPNKENFLCNHLKNLHANLNHLTWQAKQVATGDYSQHVSYLGDFSDAFNIMTEQLKEREALLEAEKERTQKRLSVKAYHDPDTGIYNRLYYNEYMEKMLRGKKDFTLVYIDLDGLKSVNDRFGHNEGDRYIRAFVSLVGSSFRNTDVFARVGGDEFAIVVSNCLKKELNEKMEELRKVFAGAYSCVYPASFSFGIVEIDGKENKKSFEEIKNDADDAMYRYKRKNKEIEGERV
ncbi:MAG: GGDEF domain-containing protein [Lachnospiraceae bacterium]|nr:GGDEF domain-containing protein [Lachnospiraceae bacterium]